MKKGQYTVIIPTMWYAMYYLRIMVKKYDQCSLIKEVLIIDNNKKGKKKLKSKKIRFIGTGDNMFVNASWNLGVSKAKTENIILANDDIIIKELEPLLLKIDDVLDVDAVIGVSEGCFAQKKLVLGDLKIDIITDNKMGYGFGTFMAMKRVSYSYIPEKLKVWYGDRWQFDLSYPFEIKGIEVKTPMRTTSKKLGLFGVSIKEGIIFKRLMRGMKKEIVNIFLVLRSGGDFKFRDVDLLVHYLHKYYSKELKVYCLTDTVSSIIELNGLTLLPLPHKEWSGWWSKMNLFSPALKKYRPFLYVDLDTAIVRDFTHLLPTKHHKNSFITLSDFYREEWLASGVMWIPKENDKINKIWEQWIKNPGKAMSSAKWGDQGFIRKCTDSDLRWQNVSNGITTFKPKKGKALLLDLPYHAAIICFHGKPRILEAAAVKKIFWVKQYVRKQL